MKDKAEFKGHEGSSIKEKATFVKDKAKFMTDSPKSMRNEANSIQLGHTAGPRGLRHRGREVMSLSLSLSLFRLTKTNPEIHAIFFPVQHFFGWLVPHRTLFFFFNIGPV
jgi:hypothetical protein